MKLINIINLTNLIEVLNLNRFIWEIVNFFSIITFNNNIII